MTTKSQCTKEKTVKLDFVIFKNYSLKDAVEDIKTQATDRK